MISQECYELGSKSSIIREIFSYGLKRKAEIGEDKVYDFSLGNPSIPAPPSVKQAILELLEEPAENLHAYSPAPGDPKVRAAIAESLNRRFGESFRCRQYLYDLRGGGVLKHLSEGPVQPGGGGDYLCAVLHGISLSGWKASGAALNVVPPRSSGFSD